MTEPTFTGKKVSSATFGGKRVGQSASAADIGVQFASGVNERLFDLIDSVPGLGEALFNQLFGGNFNDPTTSLTGALGLRETFVTPELDTPGARIARRTGQEVGAGLPLAAVPFAAARQPVQQGLNAAGQGIQTLVQGISNTPVRAGAGELAATVGAGVGAGLAQEAAPGSQAAEITGQLAGGLAPTAIANTPSALVARAARAAASRFSPQAQRRAAEEAVGNVLGQSLEAGVEANLSQSEALRRDIPGFEPSLAEGAGSPALIAQQRDIEARASGQQLDALQARRQANVEAVDRFAEQQAPGGANAPEFVIDSATRTIDETESGVIAGRRQGIAPAPTNRAQQGATLRARLEARSTAARERLSARADELGLNDEGVTIRIDEFQDRVRTRFDNPELFEDRNAVPEVVQEILDVVPAEGANQASITFREYQNLRTRISDDLGDALASNDRGKRRRVRSLVRLRRDVDRILDDAIDTAEPGLADRARTFRREFFQEVVQPFEQGPAYRVTMQDGRGTFRTADEQVAAAFFDQRGARQFGATFADDPEANAALRSVILDDLRNAAVRDGVIDPQKHAAWLRKNRGALAELPEIRQEVAQIDLVNRGLLERQAELDVRNKRIRSDVLNRKIAAIEKGTRTADQVLTDALRDPRLMRRLNSRLDQGSREDLRRVIWDRANTEDIGNFLEANRKSLDVVMSQNHIRNLEKIAAARESIASVPSQPGRAVNVDPTSTLGRELGQGIPQIGSRIFAVKSGRIGTNYMLVDAGGRLLRGRALLRADDLMREALYDPKVARDLLDLATTSRAIPQTANRLNSRLFNLGAESRREEAEPTP